MELNEKEVSLKKDLLKELEEKGIKVKETTVEKHGRKEKGFIAILSEDGEGNECGPVIYDFMLKSMSKAEILDLIYKSANECSALGKRFSIKSISQDKEVFLSSLYIALANKETLNKNLCSKETGFEGILQYIYFNKEYNDRICFIKIPTSYLTKAGISEEEAWERARANTFSNTEIVTDPYNKPINFAMFSNKKYKMGSSAILDEEALNQYKLLRKEDKSFVVFPTIDVSYVFSSPCDLTKEVMMETFIKGLIEDCIEEELITDCYYVI